MKDESSSAFTVNESAGTKLDVLCPTCNRPTEHEVASSLDKKSEVWNRAERWSIDLTDRYQVIQCCGCKTVSFRHQNWCSDAVDPLHGEDGITEFLYPERKTEEVILEDLPHVPPVLRRAYREVVRAHNSGLRILCAAGLRALLEGMCDNLGVTGGTVSRVKDSGKVETRRSTNLDGKIAGLAEGNLLSASLASELDVFRFLGNEALHELSAASKSQLASAIDVMVHLLKHFYEVPEAAGRLRRSFD